MKRTQISNQTAPIRKKSLTLLVATLSFLFILSGMILPFARSTPVVYLQFNETEQLVYQTPPTYSTIRAQNFTMEGNADLTAFVVNPDGSMTSTIMAVGDVGNYTTSSEPYQECLMALSIFRWGEYQNVFNGLLSMITNDTSGGGSELDMLLGILDLLPPNAIMMIFMGGTPVQIQTWGHAIHLEFELTLATPFERVFGMALPISNVTVGIEAYGFYGGLSPDPVEIQGRNQFQTYMETLGASRQGATALVTPALATDSIGGVGISGFINMAVLGGSPLPMRALMQPPETITFSAWASQHQDKFFGSAVQTFDVNAFCDRTGNIVFGPTLDAFEFTMLFPAGVNITGYIPPEMFNSTSPEGAMVAMTTAHWLNQSSVADIIVYFEGDFPPGLTITKTITTPIHVGGTATVTITLNNIDPTQTVYNVNLNDVESWAAYEGHTYGGIETDGNLTASWVSIGPGETRYHVYEITVPGEGSYVAQRANVTFEDALSRVWEKSSNKGLLTVVYGNLIEFILILMQDIPWSIPIIIVIVLIAIYTVIWLIKTILGIARPRRSTAPPKSAPPPPSKAPPEETLPPPPEEYDEPAKPSDETTCINCGSPIPPGVGFCPACGAKAAI